MNNTNIIQKYLGKRGLQGPIFLIDSLTGTPLLDDDTSEPIVITKSGTPVDGFYSAQAIVDNSTFSAKIVVSGWRSRTKFLRNPTSPQLSFTYIVDDSDEVLDESSNVVTPGTFSTYFDRDVVKTANNYEQLSALNLLLTLTGSSPFQITFPVSFASFSLVLITQTNINSAKET